MSQNKTQPTSNSVENFISQVADETKRNDCYKLLELMKDITKEEPVMWGASLIGFGKYHYKYASGREGDHFVSGFSPRKTALTIYIMSGFEPHQTIMKQLGKYKTGSSCLYVKKLSDIDLNLLRTLISKSILLMRERYPD